MTANAEVHKVRVIAIDREDKKVSIEKVKTGVKYRIDLPNNAIERNIHPGMELFLAITYFSTKGPVYSLRFHEEDDEPEVISTSHVDRRVNRVNTPKLPKAPTVNEIQVLCQYYELQSFYHITHVDNLANILKNGLLCRNNISGYVDISNQEIQDHRHYKRLPLYPELTLHDYAPLFVAPKPPMLSALRGQQAELVYVCFSPNVLCLPWTVFTDGNARNNKTQFYSDIKDFSKLDWKILNANYWNSDNPEVHAENKRKRSAEILVRERIYPKFINCVTILNTKLLNQVQEVMNSVEAKLPVRCTPEFYYV